MHFDKMVALETSAFAVQFQLYWLLGNVYVKFAEDDSAEKALTALANRYYGGRLLMPEFCPVTDFKDAACRQFEESECTRGGLCNFMHIKRISKSLRKVCSFCYTCVTVAKNGE